MYVHKRQCIVIPTHTDIHEHAHNSLFLFLYFYLFTSFSFCLFTHPSIYQSIDLSHSFTYIPMYTHTYKHTCTQVQTLTKKYHFHNPDIVPFLRHSNDTIFSNSNGRHLINLESRNREPTCRWPITEYISIDRFKFISSLQSILEQ